MWPEPVPTSSNAPIGSPASSSSTVASITSEASVPSLVCQFIGSAATALGNDLFHAPTVATKHVVVLVHQGQQLRDRSRARARSRNAVVHP